MSQDKIVQNLRRIEGQVKGLQRMIVEERQCDEILMQIMAAKAALDRVTSDLVENQMESCFIDMDPEAIKEKMTQTIRLLCKR
ncbi:MAG TPA: metal-sensitive transcriptional regulator [Pantanalinema sp.]